MNDLRRHRRFNTKDHQPTGKEIAVILFLMFAAGFILLVLQTSGVIGAQTARAAFSHENCQYPTRSTNPPNGCDNSDPCDPSDAAKGGSGDCKQQDGYVATCPDGTPAQGSCATPEGDKASTPTYSGEPSPAYPYKTLPEVGGTGKCNP